MAIAIALLGFNDLGHSVTPTFLFRNQFFFILKNLTSCNILGLAATVAFFEA